ncbi:maleate cis-trans isomerase family protein [Mycolicibacterium palauense]|uniref:maleate cis-trans isomerase family protein n=1 Tax=Mycolicibacterium palauense TaxID=2034511 RepID=UPI000BFEFE65|nr:aspartate/glutamate racemase family protein [Mycolicibacterium palauense]
MHTYTDLTRVGLLLVPIEVVAHEELRRLLPEDILFGHQRVQFEETDSSVNREAALESLTDALRTLHRMRPKAVAFACTSGGSFAGAKWHELLLEHLRAVDPDIDFFTAADAVARTLIQHDLRRIAMGTPYSPPVLAGLTEILTSRGIEVRSAAALFPDGPPADPWDLMTTTPGRMYEFAQEVDRRDVDCVFLSCTGLHTTPVIERIEERIGKPLLTSNIAIANVFLDALGRRGRQGFGRILSARVGGAGSAVPAVRSAL